MNGKLGWKGFENNLSCRGMQFEIGRTYSKNRKNVPVLCSADGFHYCENYKKIEEFYKGKDKRYCLIEILGPFSSDAAKSITTSFRIIQEVTEEWQSKNWDRIEDIYRSEEYSYDVRKALRDEKEAVILKKVEKEKKIAVLKEELRQQIKNEEAEAQNKLDLLYETNLNLKSAKILQDKYPLSIICGSLGLYLHGVRLSRWGKKGGDVDIISPYFIQYENSEGFTCKWGDAKASGNDFDETFILTTSEGSVKIDVKIDNKQKYETIEWKGVKYKVSKLENIWEAKIRYAMRGQNKHKNDLAELCQYKPPLFKAITSPVNLDDDLPW